MQTMTFSQAVTHYTFYAKVRRLSPHTLLDYQNTFRKFKNFLSEDIPINTITKYHIQEFLAGFEHLSEKTVLNYYASLSALWTWALDEHLVETHVVRQVRPPKPRKKEINPLTRNDIKLLLAAVDYSVFHSRKGQAGFRRTLQNAPRNKAIIIVLLDTGIRASELCQLKISDVDFVNNQFTILGKGNKQRVVNFSDRTAEILKSYLDSRGEYPHDAALFASTDNRHPTRASLLHLLYRVAKRANVPHVHPHRFRHTFAINFLRNGGNIYALQKMLGHSTLDMVKQYLQISEQDCLRAHQIASPVKK